MIWQTVLRVVLARLAPESVDLVVMKSAARFISLLALVAVCFACQTCPAHATTTDDVLTGVKTLQLLNDKPGDKAKTVIALVFDPTNLNSKSDAEDIMTSFDRDVGAAIKDMRLSAMLVSTHDLGKLANARAAFIMQNTEGAMDAIAAAAKAAHIVTMSSDLHCVQTGKCVLGISSDSSVQIYFNKEAADAVGVSFAPSFLMLVKSV